ncbi:MAG: double zinc ribbon domain-containing protein [Candidatus Bathyarchaeia archaeon]
METPRNPSLVYCNQCGSPNPAENKYCYECGTSLNTITCSFCSTINPYHASFCGSCGRKLGHKR